MDTTTYPDMAADVQAVMDAIRDDAAAGAFGGDAVSSFAELHDHVDANDYAALIDGDRFMRHVSPDADAYWDVYVPSVIDAVNAELRRAPVTA